MEIVKQFDDFEFFQKTYELAFEESDPAYVGGFWNWGLGEDGYLYCQCSDFEDPNEWYDFEEIGNYKLSLRDMKKIVKAFGHLMVYL